MAEKRYLDYAGVQYVVEELNKKIAQKANLTDLENFELPVATPNKIGGIKVGEGLAINENGVLRSTVNGGASSWEEVNNKPTTLEGYGITDAASAAQVAALENRISTVYTPRGSVATLEALQAITDPAVGDVYNIEADGMNYVWNGTDWDALGASVDLSGYMLYTDVDAITRNELDIIMGIASSVEVLSTFAMNGGEVSLSSDITTSAPFAVETGTTLTINLNNQTLASANNQPIFQVDGGTLILTGTGKVNAPKTIGYARNGGQILIENGKYDSAGNYGFAASGAGSKVVVDGGTISGQEGGVGAFAGAEVVINDGYLEGKDNFAVFTNGTAGQGGNTITMNGGVLVSNIQSAGYEACGVYIANDDTFIMNDGEILANNGCGILMRGGKVTINGGRVIATGIAGTSGWVGDNKTNMSKSAVIYHQTAKYPAVESMELKITGGTFIGVDHSVEVLSDETSPKVSVTGGSFAPAYPEE